MGPGIAALERPSKPKEDFTSLEKYALSHPDPSNIRAGARNFARISSKSLSSEAALQNSGEKTPASKG
jgi:hypothetical protein